VDLGVPDQVTVALEDPSGPLELLSELLARPHLIMASIDSGLRHTQNDTGARIVRPGLAHVADQLTVPPQGPQGLVATAELPQDDRALLAGKVAVGKACLLSQVPEGAQRHLGLRGLNASHICHDLEHRGGRRAIVVRLQSQSHAAPFLFVGSYSWTLFPSAPVKKQR